MAVTLTLWLIQVLVRTLEKPWANLRHTTTSIGAHMLLLGKTRSSLPLVSSVIWSSTEKVTGLCSSSVASSISFFSSTSWSLSSQRPSPPLLKTLFKPVTRRRLTRWWQCKTLGLDTSLGSLTLRSLSLSPRSSRVASSTRRMLPTRLMSCTTRLTRSRMNWRSSLRRSLRILVRLWSITLTRIPMEVKSRSLLKAEFQSRHPKTASFRTSWLRLSRLRLEKISMLAMRGINSSPRNKRICLFVRRKSTTKLKSERRKWVVTITCKKQRSESRGWLQLLAR